MKLKTGVVRTAVLLTSALFLVAGCSTVVHGRALIAVPRPGSPVQWAPCEAGSSEQPRVPSGAECGMLSVPVDWDTRTAPRVGWPRSR